jgi:pyruvate/2-oxoglutarate dehydrogenase complex dihydrolipoamide dehydrogenase (E3) component
MSHAVRYDAIVVGAGQAGLPLAWGLEGKGMSVALVEGDKLGGTCVNYGCSPSKTLIASAKAIHMARRGSDYGFSADVVVDFPRVMQRVRDLVDHKRGNLEDGLAQAKRIEWIRAYAAFESANDGLYRLRAGDRLIESERVYLNVGARATQPDIDGLETVAYITNESVWTLNALPEHLIIIGAGYISMEMAQAFLRFGSRVTILERSGKVLAREDQDIADLVVQLIEREGGTFVLGARVQRVEQTASGLAVHYEQNGETHALHGSTLLIAAGRTPNTDTLGGERVGLRLDARGYAEVDDHLRTNLPNVWALGEMNGHGPFTHTSYYDYEIALDNLNGGDRKLSDRTLAYAVYLDPPLGKVGLSLKDAEKTGHKLVSMEYPMHSVSRAIENGETFGKVRLIADAESRQFLGATVFGLHGDEVVQTIAACMQGRVPYTTLQETLFVHPTVTEFYPTWVGRLQ